MICCQYQWLALRFRGGDFIRIVLEASGRSAVWLTKRLDEALEKYQTGQIEGS